MIQSFRVSCLGVLLGLTRKDDVWSRGNRSVLNNSTPQTSILFT